MLTLKIVTPEACVYSDTVDAVVIPTKIGRKRSITEELYSTDDPEYAKSAELIKREERKADETGVGEIDIRPGHIPLMTIVKAGELRVTKDGKEEHIIIGDGFAEIEGDRVSILAENAINESIIDETAVAEAIKRAEEALKNRDDMDSEELDRVEAAMRYSLAQLAAKLRK